MLAGQSKKFSWTKLLSEIIMKFGLFGIITSILDILWQIIFPIAGLPDYNDLVYKNVRHPELEKECAEDIGGKGEDEDNVKNQEEEENGGKEEEDKKTV